MAKVVAPKVGAKMPRMVESTDLPGRPKLPIQLISADELLACEGIADKSMGNLGRPRLRKPAAAGGTTTAAAAKSSPAASDLPAGWVAMKDEEGDIFYYNQATGECPHSAPKQAIATGNEASRNCVTRVSR